MSNISEKTIYQAYGELREIIDGGSESFTHEDAVQYLKDKLAQPAVAEQHKQEPVAWELGAEVYWGDSPELSDYVRKEGTPLYTTPPQRTAAEGEDTNAWVGLTDDEMWNAYTGGSDIINLDYAKAIEAKLKEKNT